MSTLTKSQKLTLTKTLSNGDRFVATIRYDDECGNGHNTFAITGDLYEPGHRHPSACGCLHDEFIKAFPEYAYLVKWHLCSSDGPMHYIANTTYHALEHGPKSAYVYEYAREIAGVTVREKLLCSTDLDKAQAMVDECPDLLYLVVQGDTAKVANLDYARSTAIAPDATLKQLRDVAWLENRLPVLLDEFRADIEALGFTW